MTHPLEQLIPAADALLALGPEELGGSIIRTILDEPDWHLGAGVTIIGYLDGIRGSLNAGPAAWGGARNGEVLFAIREAWAWLEGQGLIIPSEGTNGQNGWRQLARRAADIATPEGIANFQAARALPRQLLHPDLAEQVWMDFLRGDFDNAVYRAMKRVEVRLRQASGAGPDLLGVRLAGVAFHIENGPLTDHDSEEGEKVAIRNLFSGALGAIKNPQSHRDVNMDDPREAAAVVMFASYLLSLIDAREGRLHR
ncbi:TIGR02391 family protein [Brevundimonas mediterranea]|jgi:uncharacterized protein (TIGR02391 family)|uniref:Uncharacterized protein (TIGR02391 family) n=1 Tax=Brevundimonas mediterranea TaxID=74329 RepID=A0A7W6A2X8_9CAUL|nr:TIGR02391 family protein [Brevundimonas mediterranea]MBB3871217.1 uncharacterized protein (TIGR02391 family) [Brevundimonas mediterranea]